MQRREVFIHTHSGLEKITISFWHGEFGTDEFVSKSYEPGQVSLKRLNTVLEGKRPYAAKVSKHGLTVNYECPKEVKR